MTNVKPIPEGFSTATPNLVVERGAEAIEAPVAQFITLYVDDADALHARALAAVEDVAEEELRRRMGELS
jgi:hypothetical protein